MSEESKIEVKQKFNLVSLIISKIKSKDYPWLGLFIIVPTIIILILGSLLANNYLGLTADAARGKLKSLKLGVTDFDGYKYSSSNKDQSVIDLFTRAGVKKQYLIAGLINNGPKSITNIESLISGDIDVTTSIPNLNDYQLQLGQKSASNECTSLLSLTTKLDLINIASQLLNKGKITNPNDCSLKQAIASKNSDIISLYSSKLKLTKSDINTLVKNGDTGVIPFMNADNVDKDTLSALLSMDHSAHDSKDHDKIESLISDAVFNNISKEIKDQELSKAIDSSKFNIVASLIRKGASYDKLIKPYGFDKEISLYDYGISKKEDSLVTSIIDAGYKYNPIITTISNGVSTTDNLLYYCIQSKMNTCAQTLIDKGFDLSTTYKPSSTDSTQYPIVFAAAANSEQFPIITKMIEKANVVKTLSPENKKKFLAYLLYNFSQTPKVQDIDAIKSVLTQDVDINSNLYYSPNETGGYAEGGVPVWSQPLFNNPNFNSIPEEQVKSAFNKYIELIGDKITKFDFTKDRLTSIGVATHLGQSKLVELMLKKGVNPNSPDSSNNQTPIMLVALKKSYFDIAKLFIDNKIDLNLDITQSSYSTEKTSYLINFIQSFNGPNKLEGVKLLVENGANINKCYSVNDLEQICPLSAASYENSKSDVTTYLETKGAKCEFVSRGLCKK
jgi:hypothetical protein